MVLATVYGCFFQEVLAINHCRMIEDKGQMHTNAVWDCYSFNSRPQAKSALGFDLVDEDGCGCEPWSQWDRCLVTVCSTNLGTSPFSPVRVQEEGKSCTLQGKLLFGCRNTAKILFLSMTKLDRTGQLTAFVRAR